MFSNDLKNEMKTKFNLTESLINSSKHYKIPRFVFKAKSVKPINKNYNFFMKNHIISLRNYLNNKSDELKKLSKTQYFERKRENMNKLLTKIQRDKIDLLINKAYENINDKIREYNNSISLSGREYKIKLDFLPEVRQFELLEWLGACGFHVNPDVTRCKTREEVHEFCQRAVERRDDLPYEIDGVVVKVNSFTRQAAMGYFF